MATRARRAREAAAGERRVIRGAGGSGWVSKCRVSRPREQAGVSQLTEEEAAAAANARSYQESAGCWGRSDLFRN